MFLVFGANGIVGVRKPALYGLSHRHLCAVGFLDVGYDVASRALSRFELLRLGCLHLPAALATGVMRRSIIAMQKNPSVFAFAENQVLSLTKKDSSLAFLNKITDTFVVGEQTFGWPYNNQPNAAL